VITLDYHNWDRTIIPIIAEMFEDERCPCLNNCVVSSICTQACEEMTSYLSVTISETISYLRCEMGTRFYNEVYNADIFPSSNILKGLVNLKYHTVRQEKLVFEQWACITKRFIYSMKRVHQIAVNANRKNSKITIEHFVMGL